MGYAREKERTDKQVKRIKRIAFCIVVVIVFALCLLMSFSSPTSWKYYFFLPDVTERNTGELRVHFIDVGQGDSTVIELPDGKIMLIDGGNGSDESDKAVLRHLNALDIDVIDYLVVTHADKDHFGGLIRILKYKKVVYAYLPIAVEDETNNLSYIEFLSVLSEEGCQTETASFASSKAFFGNKEYTLAFLYPYIAHVNGAEEVTDSNEASVIVWLEYKDASFLFTGDGTANTEYKLMLSQQYGLHDLYGVDIRTTDFLKVAHHGAKGATELAFLKYLGIKHAIISCGKDNGYGHPDKEVCDRLEEVGAQIYRTDRQGSIVITVNFDGQYHVETLGK